MEGWLIIGGIFGIMFLWSWVASLLEKRRQRIRDEAAKEVIAGRDIDSEFAQYKEKLHYIGYKNYHIPGSIRSYFPNKKDEQKSDENTLFGACDDCKDGQLRFGKSRYGQILYCSNYPRCRNVQKYSRVKASYQQSIGDEFREDLKRAYSL